MLLNFEKTDSALFTGIEHEGQYRNYETLFIVGEVPLDIISMFFFRHRVDQLYFGAGGTYVYDKKSVISMRKLFSGVITVEDPHLENLMWVYANSIHWVVPITLHSLGSNKQAMTRLIDTQERFLRIMGSYLDLSLKLDLANKTITIPYAKFDIAEFSSYHDILLYKNGEEYV
jgi:hypothetical protein